MAALLFPDNTVLINFAIINRMDLLERLANGNGHWCATVASECHASASRPGLGALVDADEIFEKPWFPDTAELVDTRLLRDSLASPGDRPDQHLGEAETLAIMIRRNVVGFFVTDDNEAARLAAKNGIQTIKTWQLLKVAANKGWVDHNTLWGYVKTLRSHGRGSPQGVTDLPSLAKWLSG